MILGDNTSALMDALNLKGKGTLVHIARELSWRKARFQWKLQVAHVPSVMNAWTDALSRLHAPAPALFPAPLVRARRVQPPALLLIWQAWLDTPP